MIRMLMLAMVSALTLSVAAMAAEPKASTSTHSTTISTKHHTSHKKSSEPKNVIAAAEKSGTYKTLIELVKMAGLEETLQGPGPFTVFAPTDAAFAKVPAATLASWKKPENKDALRQMLSAHVISGKITSKELAGKKEQMASLSGQSLTIDGTKGKEVTVDGVKVSKADILTENGIIHSIDAVIMPPQGTTVTQ